MKRKKEKGEKLAEREGYVVRKRRYCVTRDNDV